MRYDSRPWTLNPQPWTLRLGVVSLLGWCILTGLALGVMAEEGMLVQACFTPETRCSNHILHAIGEARKEILAAVYAFTSQDLARALVRARRRGVTVRVVLDREFDRENVYSQGEFLEREGVSVGRASGLQKSESDHGLMHQKFAIVDGTTVLSGSYNWTYSADRFNDESLLLFRNARPLAEAYRREFSRLWRKAESGVERQ